MNIVKVSQLPLNLDTQYHGVEHAKWKLKVLTITEHCTMLVKPYVNNICY